MQPDAMLALLGCMCNYMLMTKSTLYPNTTVKAWAALLRAHKSLTELVQRELAAADLPPLEWYDVLLELKTSPGRQLRLNELGERIVLSKSNLTRICDRLEARRLILREPCKDDGRGVLATITNDGEKLRRTMWPVYRAAIERHFGARLSNNQLQQLSDILVALRKA